MTIYTRNGDSGMTGLATGQKVPKNSPIIEFIGALDELNAVLGVCVASLDSVTEHDFSVEAEVVEDIQRDLFAVGAIAVGAKMAFNASSETTNIEKTIDDYEKLLPKLQNFILPGGAEPAANLHHARTIVRNLERHAVNTKSQSLTPFLPYLNRLSDLLFVMARYVNLQLKSNEVMWKG